MYVAADGHRKILGAGKQNSKFENIKVNIRFNELSGYLSLCGVLRVYTCGNAQCKLLDDARKEHA